MSYGIPRLVNNPRLTKKTPLKRELDHNYYRDSYSGSIYNTVINYPLYCGGSFMSGFGRSIGYGLVNFLNCASTGLMSKIGGCFGGYGGLFSLGGCSGRRFWY